MLKQFSHRLVDPLAACAAVVGFVLAAPAAAHASDQPVAVNVYTTLSPGRVGAIVAAVFGLIGVVVGGSGAAGRISTSIRRRRAIVALVLAPIGLIVGASVVVAADGGLGTGNGLGGGVVAMVIGLFGMALGGLALARSRRTV